jgi:hypothetical protein
MMGPKHTVESVIRELREGLLNGTVVLDRPDAETRASRSIKLSKDRLKTFVANEAEIVYDRGLDQGKAQVSVYTFTAHKKTGMGLFSRTRQKSLSIVFIDDEPKFLAGDMAEIDTFDIPPEIKKRINYALSVRGTLADLASIGVDTLFVGLWAGINLGVRELGSRLHLGATGTVIFAAVQVLFGISTILPSCIFVYRDLRILWIRASQKIAAAKQGPEL